jgi:hypothetical protein
LPQRRNNRLPSKNANRIKPALTSTKPLRSGPIAGREEGGLGAADERSEQGVAALA